MNRRIIAAVNDMFFAAKIRGTAQHLDINVEFPRSADALIKSARVHHPPLIIFDLHAQAFDPFALAEQLKIDESLCYIPLVAFYSHVLTELQRQAREAGFDRVMPRSVFSKHLPEILEGNF